MMNKCETVISVCIQTGISELLSLPNPCKNEKNIQYKFILKYEVILFDVIEFLS